MIPEPEDLTGIYYISEVLSSGCGSIPNFLSLGGGKEVIYVNSVKGFNRA